MSFREDVLHRNLISIYLKILERASQSKVIRFFLCPLTILSFFFWIGTIVRKHLLRKKQSNIPIVTVGNISFGGTGKTPFLLYLLKYLDGSACYVSRGYGRKSKGNFVGKWPSCTYEACGDEAMQVTRRFSSTVLSIAADKWQAIQNVPDGTRLILLDDGLQRYDIPKVVEMCRILTGWEGFFHAGF